jgi:hypothetical protein
MRICGVMSITEGGFSGHSVDLLQKSVLAIDFVDEKPTYATGLVI